MGGVERFCILATGDKHQSLEKNLIGLPGDVADVYLRDTEKASDVRGYIEMVQVVEALCFRMPSENWVLAHFGLNGPGMVVTAEIDSKPVGAQYVAADCWEGKMGLRFWTTVVRPEMRRLRIASLLSALSTFVTRSWAQFGGTISDTDSSLMGRNVKLGPIVVTANMHHTPGRKKVLLEWKTPDDPFAVMLEDSKEPADVAVLPRIESLLSYDLTGLPSRFLVSPNARVWEDIVLHSEKYRRYFKLVGWQKEEKNMVLEKPNR